MVCNAAKGVETGHNLPKPSREAFRRADRTSSKTRGRADSMMRKAGPLQWQQWEGGVVKAWSEPHRVHAWHAKGAVVCRCLIGSAVRAPSWAKTSGSWVLCVRA